MYLESQHEQRVKRQMCCRPNKMKLQQTATRGWALDRVHN